MKKHVNRKKYDPNYARNIYIYVYLHIITYGYVIVGNAITNWNFNWDFE